MAHKQPRYGLVVVALLGFAAPAHAQDAVGRAMVVEGSPRISNAGGVATLAKGDAVAAGDTIETANGRVRLRMHDDSVITLGRDTVLTIDEYLLEAEADRGGGLLDLVRGRVKALVGRMFGGSSPFQVQTPTSIAGVRGTYFRIDHEDDRSTATVFGGSLELRTHAGDDAVVLSAGEQATIGMDGFTRPPQRVPGGRLRSLEFGLEAQATPTLPDTGGKLDRIAADTLAAQPARDASKAQASPEAGGPIDQRSTRDTRPNPTPPINLESLDPARSGTLGVDLTFPEVE